MNTALESMMNRHVLITGIGGPAGWGAVSYFRNRGFRVIGTDIKRMTVPVESFYIVPTAVSPSFKDILMEIILKARPFLLVPTVTEELPVIATLKDAIETHGCRVFISHPSTIEITNDKLKTAVTMMKYGIPVPLSFDEYTPKAIILDRVGLPALSKPRYGRGGRGVTIYWRREDLLTESRKGIIFQEFIPGDEYNINIFVGKTGRVKSIIVLRKTMLKDGITGNALSTERVDRPDIARLGIRIAKVLGLVGPADIDVRLRRNGRPVVLEINGRIGGNILSATEILNTLLDDIGEGK